MCGPTTYLLEARRGQWQETLRRAAVEQNWTILCMGDYDVRVREELSISTTCDADSICTGMPMGLQLFFDLLVYKTPSNYVRYGIVEETLEQYRRKGMVQTEGNTAI